MSTSPESESPTTTATRAQVHRAFLDNLHTSGELVQTDLFEEFHEFELASGDRLSDAYTEAILRNQIIFHFGSDDYERHMGQAGRQATRRPFGIEVGTLSPHVRLVLSPYTVFAPTEDARQQAEEEEVAIPEEGPQAIVYFLDGSVHEKDAVNFAPNFALFLPFMSLALIQGEYPVELGERSPEFQQQALTAFELVHKYVHGLPEELRAQLSSSIARIGNLDPNALRIQAENFVRYQTEPMKMPGLYERPWFKKETPKEAVEQGFGHLHVDARNLPLRPAESEGVPAVPWTEYATNRYTRNHQLFGRYEHVDGERILRVDYQLDTTHMPAKYGFFHEVEIMEVVGDKMQQHIILGQEVGNPVDPNSVFPIIIAGQLNPEQEMGILHQLIADKGTKPEISHVLADTVELQDKGQLLTVDQWRSGK